MTWRYRSYISSINTFHVIGEVVNEGTAPLEFVRVSGTFYNSAAQVVASEFTYVYMDVLMPGMKSPFDMLVLDGGSLGITNYELQVTFDKAYSQPVQGLSVQGLSSYTDQYTGSYHILGEVTNASGQAVQFVKVVGTLYDAAGEVVGVGFTYTNPDAIATGGKASFDLLFLDDEVLGPVSSSAVLVEAS